jgi:dimethylaniline monooxygenase (N-oxide forming)
MINRFNNLIKSLLPFSMVCSMIESRMEQRINHVIYQLKPKHRILSQHPCVNDALPNAILSGAVIVKGDIDYFTEYGVVFKGYLFFYLKIFFII